TKVKIKKQDKEQLARVIEKEVQQTAVVEQNVPVNTEKIELQPTSNVTEEQPVATTDFDYEIVSPMVGTFYKAPSPESEPYVKVDSQVNENSIVCIVEAMKLFNEIEAEVSGKIVEILVQDGELVEYGQPLFRVKTT